MHEKCLLCDQEEETANHLLITCPLAREVWWHVCSWGRCVRFHGSITHGVVGTIGDGPGAAPKRMHVHAVYANMLDDL